MIYTLGSPRCLGWVPHHISAALFDMHRNDHKYGEMFHLAHAKCGLLISKGQAKSAACAAHHWHELSVIGSLNGRFFSAFYEDVVFCTSPPCPTFFAGLLVENR